MCRRGAALPIEYPGFKLFTLKGKDLLFADRMDAATPYSNIHMSAGERALLRNNNDFGMAE